VENFRAYQQWYGFNKWDVITGPTLRRLYDAHLGYLFVEIATRYFLPRGGLPIR